MTKLGNRCTNCGGKFGLVHHQHWGLRFCRRACKDDFLAKTARMRKWLGWLANPAICRSPVEVETEAQSNCNDTTSPTSDRKPISYSSVSIETCHNLRTTKLEQAQQASSFAHKGHLFGTDRTWVSSASKVDYLVRRWVIRDHPCDFVGHSHDSAFPERAYAKQSTRRREGSRFGHFAGLTATLELEQFFARHA